MTEYANNDKVASGLESEIEKKWKICPARWYVPAKHMTWNIMGILSIINDDTVIYLQYIFIPFYATGG